MLLVKTKEVAPALLGNLLLSNKHNHRLDAIPPVVPEHATQTAVGAIGHGAGIERPGTRDRNADENAGVVE